MPAFSVVIPTIGRDYLLDAVQSVFAQGVDDVEVVVVVDGPHALPTLPEDARIRVVRRPVSGGAGAARNSGVAVATGDHVTFLDDDDRWLPGWLEAATAALARAPIVVGWRDYVDQDSGVRTAGERRELEGDVRGVIVDEPIPHLGSTALRRDLVEPFDEALATSEDLEWWIRQAGRASVTTVPHVGYLMRVHQGERRSHTSRKKLDSRLRILEKHAAYFAGHPRAAAYHWKRAGGMAHVLGDHRTARRAFLRSLRSSPRPGTLVRFVRALRPSRRA